MEAAEVVADLLTMARGAASMMERVDINELIGNYLVSADCMKLQRDHGQVRIGVHLGPGLPPVACSPVHIRKCLMNLIINAAEAIDGEGRIEITTALYHHPAAAAGQGGPPAAGDYLLIEVADSGGGIAAEALPHIFEPFYTKKNLGRSGTGLGLSIVWNTLREHGGTVQVASSPAGTTFSLYLPLSSQAAPPGALPDKDDEQSRGDGELILVIDDDPRQREITGRLLRSLGYTPVTAASGEDGLAIVATRHIDLVILDMLMDPGINGRETYQRILDINPGQKAIIASGFAEDDDVKATLAMGASVFIAKPFTLAELRRNVHQVLCAESAASGGERVDRN